jgi:hypothetical protein
VPNAAATIIPFDVQNRIRVLQEHQAHVGTLPASVARMPGPSARGGPSADDELRHLKAAAAVAAPAGERPEPLPGAGTYDRPVPPKDATPIGTIREPGKYIVEGRVRAVEIRSVQNHSMPGNSVLACELSDSTGDLTALFYGRSKIAGMMCGSRVRLRGQAGIKDGAPVMVNPAYELIVPHSTGKKGE